ncbi:MAG: family 43 glycosylhydrolase [Chloroflexi bacterium]|jgi:beta-fructofuranosidase|nr:family 43 glycosylhydrolase [Chloroflexota bacterium]
MSIFYRPMDGVAADFIPFYWNGDYHLFYLKDYRDPEGHGEGTPWFHLVTRDFVHFEDWGEALPRGGPDDQDRWVFTGSVIERQGTFHIFYTGHNGHFAGTGRPVQAVMHATSPDLRTWTKDEGFLFFAPTELGYEPDDWRDPYVFWNEETGEYWMLLAARRASGPPRHRGCIALATSPDLLNWQVRDPLWAPDLYYTHECPDLFRIGDWWYLVYSTFSERSVTHYRMSRTLDGPWLAPPNDTFDGRPYYAAKTAGDGERRYVFGWLATRAGEKDDGAWQWGGNLVVHEVIQQADDTLKVRPPESVLAPFTEQIHLTPQLVLGKWSVSAEDITAASVGRFSAMTLGQLPDECLIEATFAYGMGTANCGLLLRTDNSLEHNYQLRIEPANQRLVLDRWPRPGDQPFMLERPLNTSPNIAINLTVLLDGTCLVAYVNDELAMSARLYEHRQGALGIFCSEGDARFDRLVVKTRK